jgi:hypothetical protein
MKCVWLLVLAAVVRVPLASVDAECKTPWQDCGSTDLKINNVIVKGCCAVPCDVVLGGTTEFSFTFTPDKTFKGLNQTVCGELGPLCEKFPNEHFENMCNCEGCTLSKPCPFEANTMYNITVDVPLPASFPAVG